MVLFHWTVSIYPSNEQIEACCVLDRLLSIVEISKMTKRQNDMVVRSLNLRVRKS